MFAIVQAEPKKKRRVAMASSLFPYRKRGTSTEILGKARFG
jgi:hypothetical protein